MDLEFSSIFELTVSVSLHFKMNESIVRSYGKNYMEGNLPYSCYDSDDNVIEVQKCTIPKITEIIESKNQNMAD